MKMSFILFVIGVGLWILYSHLATQEPSIWTGIAQGAAFYLFINSRLHYNKEMQNKQP